ncbi:hypothetical protein ACF1G0_35150 [Streptomyces sp. NPDC013953]|uniref:hypothetical protein n=1 Tax=Streptomyces sp. NPDC013953 TaxID=3364868 RepID=UPI00370288E3
MTVHIDPLGAAILVVGLVVGCLVYRHTRSSVGPTSRGDIVGAIASAVAVVTALVLLLGGGSKATAESEAPHQMPSTGTVTMK